MFFILCCTILNLHHNILVLRRGLETMFFFLQTTVSPTKVTQTFKQVISDSENPIGVKLLYSISYQKETIIQRIIQRKNNPS